MIDSIEKWLRTASFLCGAVALGAMPLLIAISIISRHIGISLGFPVEYSTYLLPVVALMAGGYVLGEGGHVSTDIVTSRLSESVRRWLELVGLFFGLAFLSVIEWQCFSLAMESLRFGYRSMYTTRTFIGYPQLLISVGIFFFILQIVIVIIRRSRDVRRKSGRQSSGERA